MSGRMHAWLGLPLALFLACGPSQVAAQAVPLVPEPAAAHAAIDALPAVAAARARAAAAGSQAAALRAGPYGFQLSVAPLARHERSGPTYSEWEATLSHQLRLPAKGRLDQALGEVGREAAMLALDDAHHMGARLLLERWFAWLRGAAVAALAAREHASLAEDLRAIELRVARGDLARIDLDRAAAAVARAELELSKRTLDREQARMALAQQFPQVVLPGGVPEVPAPADGRVDEASTIAAIIERSHEIGGARAAARRQALVADRAAADRRPDPSVGLRVLDEADHSERGVGMVVTIPFAGPAQAPTALADSQLITAAEAEAAAVAQVIELEARQLVAARVHAVAAWQAAARAARASNTAFARVAQAWRLGEADFAALALARREREAAAQGELLARLDAEELRLRLEIDLHERWSEHDDEE